jgi:hypothetical protein
MFSHDQQVLRRHGDLGVVGLLESPFRIITSTEPILQILSIFLFEKSSCVNCLRKNGYKPFVINPLTN